MEGSYRRIMQLQMANLFAETFAWSFVYLHAHNAGYSEVSIAIFFTLMFGWAGVAVVALLRPAIPSHYMAIGLVLRLFALLAVIEIAWVGNLMAGAIFYGTFIMVFWVPFNVAFMRLTTDSDRAGRSTQLFAMFAVAGAIFPFMAGYLLDWYGFWLVALYGSISLVVGVDIARRTSWGEPVVFDLRGALRDGLHLTPLVFLEGFWQGIFWISVFVGTLRMTDQGAQFGAFLAFLGIMAGIASVLAGRWSDRTGERWPPLLVSGVGLAVFIGVLTLGEGNLTQWSLLAGLAYFFAYMLMAFTFTVVGEMGLRIDDAMGLREIMFNLGRALGGTVFIFALLLGLPFFLPLTLAAFTVVLKIYGYRRYLKGHDHMPT
jgi:hypothetical protein